jgi:hypothetical protein
MKKSLIKKIENICQEHLDNTEIDNLLLCHLEDNGDMTLFIG